MPLNTPIFITGLRRSGTSLVKRLLDGHPELFVYPPNELHVFRHTEHDGLVSYKIDRGPELEDIKRALTEEPSLQKLADPESRVHRPCVDVEGFCRCLLGTPVGDLAGLFEAVRNCMAAHGGHVQGDPAGLRFVVKTVLESEYFLEMADLFPDMKMVYVLRNPYGHLHAVRTISRKGYTGAPKDDPFPYLGSEIRRMHHSFYFMRKFQSLFPDRFRVLVYDQLVNAPKAELTALSRFLSIEFHESLLVPSICGQPCSSQSTVIGEVGPTIDPRPSALWTKTITPLEVHLVNRHFLHILDEFGFEVLEAEGDPCSRFGLKESRSTYKKNRALLDQATIDVFLPLARRNTDAYERVAMAQRNPLRVWASRLKQRILG